MIGPDNHGNDVDKAEHNYRITPCKDGSYCCGVGLLADQCCTDKKGVFVINGLPTDVNPSANSSSQSSTSLASLTASTITIVSSSSASSPASTGAASANSKSSNHTGAIVGGVIGGVAVVVLAVGFFLFLGQRKICRQQNEPMISRTISKQGKPDIMHELSAQQMTELDTGKVTEMDEARSFREMK